MPNEEKSKQMYSFCFRNQWWNKFISKTAFDWKVPNPNFSFYSRENFGLTMLKKRLFYSEPVSSNIVIIFIKLSLGDFSFNKTELYSHK